MNDQRFGNQPPHGHSGVQRRHRILKHDLHPAPQRPRSRPVLTVKGLSADLDSSLMRHQPDDGLGNRRLPTPRLPYQRKRLAPPDVQTDMLHGMHLCRGSPQHAALHGKPHHHIRKAGDHLSLHGLSSLAPPKPRHCRQQRLRVGLLRAGKDVVRRPLFHHLPVAHHNDTVCHLGHHPHVMRDQDNRRPQVALQIAEQVQHLALNGHIKCRRRLIRNEHLRTQGNRHRDHHPLPHPARQFVRILPHPLIRLRQPHRLQRRQRLSAGLGPVHQCMGPDRLGQLGAHGQNRVQAGHRLLKDHRDAISPQSAHLWLGQGGQVHVAQMHRPARDLHCGRRQQTHDGQRRNRLPRPAFPGDR